jgi:hypothetical protein
MWRTLLVLAVAAPVALGGCTLMCTTEARSGIVVDVTDADTGLPIATATVTLAEGDYVEVLGPDDGFDGSYAGAWERAGVYEVEVIAAGYAPGAANGVRVEQDDCHVDGVRIAIALEPTPPPP